MGTEAERKHTIAGGLSAKLFTKRRMEHQLSEQRWVHSVGGVRL